MMGIQNAGTPCGLAADGAGADDAERRVGEVAVSAVAGVDGQKCGEFRGINWRSTDALKVNKVQLSLWLEQAGYARVGGGTTRTVWYDDVVVATQYIGPKS
jgi:hypothetical protein